MSDKRAVSTDALETLGTIIGDGAGRDAIHLAVEPVIAAHTLRPGQDVGLRPNGQAGVSNNPVGIVDPFLRKPVLTGERFWLVVYPRKITSLRHVWEHPAFIHSPEFTSDVDIKLQSQDWIRSWSATIPVDYDEVMEHASWWVKSKENGGWGDYWCDGGRFEGVGVPDEFWKHYQIVTEKSLAEEQKGSFFTCSC